MRKIIVAVFGISMLLCFCVPSRLFAGLRFGMASAAQDKVKELDQKVEVHYMAALQTVPSGLSAVIISSVQIDLSWVHSFNGTDYRIERSIDGVGYAPAGLTKEKTYSDIGLTPDTTYWYRVKACNLLGATGYSNEACGSTLSPGETNIQTPDDTSYGGGKIAFVSERDGKMGIYTINADGSGERLITPLSVNSECYNPLWSPDGTKIAYIYRERMPIIPSSIHLGLYVVNSDGTGERDVIRSTSDICFAVDSEGPATWSPDSSRLAFRIEGGLHDQGLYMAKYDGTGLTQLTNEVVYFPDWSPDGNTIVFSTSVWRDEISKYSFDSGSIVSLNAIGTNPVWSPNGKNIAFFYGIACRLMNAGGGSIRKLVDGWYYSWSPDGLHMASLETYEKTLRVIDLDGGNAIDLLSGYEVNGLLPLSIENNYPYNLGSCWSPDGKRLVFVYKNELYSIIRDGSGLKKITNNAQVVRPMLDRGLGPQWSPK